MAIPQVTHKMLKKFIDLSFRTYRPILITGKPGIGKTVATMDYCKDNDINLIVSHPVISDPTDFKGFPAKAEREVQVDALEAMLTDEQPDVTIEQIATFLPFGDLLEAMEATEDTIWFFDDFGQAPMAVQAACMQIIGGRRIGDKKISDQVRIVAATNRREDNAGVKGLLEPVKSRFGMIVELVADRVGFQDYAYSNQWQQSIIDFCNYTVGAIEDFKPTKTMENSPNPRLWGYLSELLENNTEQDEDFIRILCSSCIGQLYGDQFSAFLKVYSRLPSYMEIVAEPEDYPLDQKLDVRMAMLGMLANQGKEQHADQIFKFINRLAKEYQVIFVRALASLKSELLETGPCQLWTASNMEIYLG